jgi:hypothetical protein
MIIWAILLAFVALILDNITLATNSYVGVLTAAILLSGTSLLFFCLANRRCSSRVVKVTIAVLAAPCLYVLADSAIRLAHCGPLLAN